MSSADRIYIVDDDEAVRESLAALLSASGYKVETFSSAQSFLDSCNRSVSGCLIADIRMPEMDGLELQERVAASLPDIAVVMMTGHADVPIAVRVMKAGAVDFVEKPFTEAQIIQSARLALDQLGSRAQADAAEATLRNRLALLSDREREVLDGLVAGLPNKTIAYNLGISPRTVEVHRARVMDKMQAKSLSELVRFVIAAGGANGRRHQ